MSPMFSIAGAAAASAKWPRAFCAAVATRDDPVEADLRQHEEQQHPAFRVRAG